MLHKDEFVWNVPTDVEDYGYERNSFDKIALIDADRLKYLVTLDISKEIKNSGSSYCRSEINKFIDQRLGSMIFNRFEAKGYLFCFSGSRKDTARYQQGIEKEYKGNRPPPSHEYDGIYQDMAEVVKYISKRYPTLVFKDLEADDIVAFLQNEHTFIMSNDKDLVQVPGMHYHFEQNRLFEVTPVEGFRSLIRQLYTGDSTDNFIGLKGVGEKGAIQALEEENPTTLLYECLHKYMTKHGMVAGIDCFVESWNLACMRLNRGTYFKSKYQHAFDTLENLMINSGL